MNNAANKYIPAEIIKLVNAIGHIINAIMELPIFFKLPFTKNLEN